MIIIYCITLILATITLTFSLNNVILLFNFISIILILSFSLLVFNLISITTLILIIYSSLSSILFLVNGLILMYSLSFKYISLNNDFGLIMNLALMRTSYSFPSIINYDSFSFYQSFILGSRLTSVMFICLFESIIAIDSYSTLYLCFPYSFHFLNHGFNGVGNLIFNNSLFILSILFFIVCMININLLFFNQGAM